VLSTPHNTVKLVLGFHARSQPVILFNNISVNGAGVNTT